MSHQPIFDRLGFHALNSTVARSMSSRRSTARASPRCEPSHDRRRQRSDRRARTPRFKLWRLVPAPRRGELVRLFARRIAQRPSTTSARS